MPKFAITDLTAEEFAKCMSALGNTATAGASLPPQTQGQPVTTAPLATGAPPPTNSAPGGAPPQGAAAPPPPPQQQAAPPPPQGNGAVTQQSCMAAMQKYGATHKAPGIKAVLAKCGLTGIGNANPEQLAWLQQAFESNLPPEQLG